MLKQLLRPLHRSSQILAANRFPITCLALSLCLPVSAMAEEWSFIGARYQGMGGAGVAMVNDEHAAYWNPGALAFSKGYGVALPVGLQAAAEGSILANVDAVSNYLDTLASGEFDQLLSDLDAGNALDSTQLGTAIELAAVQLPGLAGPGEGLVGSANASLLLRYKRVSVSGLGIGYFGADPFFDQDNLSVSNLSGAMAVDALINPGTAIIRFPTSVPTLVGEVQAIFATAASTLPLEQAHELVFAAQQAGVNVDDPAIRQNILNLVNATVSTTTGNNFADNQSGAFLRGLAVEQIGIGYGHPFLNNRIGVGANVKYMFGTTFNKFVRFNDIDSGSDLIDDIGDAKRRETTHTASLDLGVLVKPWNWLRFGLTARNVTSPEFNLARDPNDPSGKSKLTLDPQVRMGAAIWILPNWAIAFDADLTENKSALLEGFKSRLVSLGTEFKLPVGPVEFAFRGGAYLNTAAQELDQIALSAGLGLRLFGFTFDLAVGGSPKTESVEAASDTKIPSRANVSATLSYRSSF